MEYAWYLKRLRKMSAAEVFKRAREQLYISYTRIKYSSPTKCVYRQFSEGSFNVQLQALPSAPVTRDWKHYQIYNYEFDLTQPLDWFFSETNVQKHWPTRHFADINYRPGNPFGDIRINWELSRLQFLPTMAVSNPPLTEHILSDWFEKNPFLYGPGYVASMEVAIRWISIYWAACLLGKSLKPMLHRNLIGLANASGSYIENRLSTHSSSGNHLIVEAVGLFWLGKALEQYKSGRRWIRKAREITHTQVIRQINSDGSNREQSFWYLGFVVDALLHYLLIEDRGKIPDAVWLRIAKALEFIHDLTLPDGTFPDYGDRDDGHIFRINNGYTESPFPGLLNTGAHFFKQPEWLRDCETAKERLRFWQNDRANAEIQYSQIQLEKVSSKSRLKIYPEGGMTLMQWGKGRLLFRHASLGLENTYGHGHADALSVIFYWDSIPVLIDLGSGQYNGNQVMRNYFRSTIAHNTVEIGRQNQAKILGPFMWNKSYKSRLTYHSESPVLSAEATHDGYMENFGRLCTRKITWLKPDHLDVCDFFSNGSEVPIRGAFHLGACQKAYLQNNSIKADFDKFWFSIQFPADFSVDLYYGSEVPFLGWRSTVYGKWEPIHSIVFSTKLFEKHQYRISLKISEK